MKTIVLSVFLFLTGCAAVSQAPQTPYQTLLAGYETLLTYIDAINSAEASKLITAERRMQLMARANDAYAFLEDARLYLAGTPPSELLCTNTTNCLQRAQSVLTEIENNLPKGKTP